MIVFSDYDQRQTLHRGEVHPFIERSRAGAAVADVSQADGIFLLHARAQKDSRHHRNHVPEMGNWADEPTVQITEMNVEIFSAGRTPGFGHVLGKDFARGNPFDETRAEIANDRRDEIVRTQRVG